MSRLSQVYAGAPLFSVAFGNTPDLEAVRDSHDEAMGGDSHAYDADGDAHQGKAKEDIRRDPEIQDIITRMWTLASRGETKEGISKVGYIGLQCRLCKTLLPNLSLKEIETMAANAWEEDVKGRTRMEFRLFFEAMCRFAEFWSPIPNSTCCYATLHGCFYRITKTRVTWAATGESEVRRHRTLVSLSRRLKDPDAEPGLPSCCYSSNLIAKVYGDDPKNTKCTVGLSGSRTEEKTQAVWYDESAEDGTEGLADGDAAELLFADMEEIIPIGVGFSALESAIVKVGEEGCTVDVTSSSIDKSCPLQQVRAACVDMLRGPDLEDLNCALEVTESGNLEFFLCEKGSAPRPLTLVHFLARVMKAMKEDISTFALRPQKNFSMLYQLERIQMKLPKKQGESPKDAYTISREWKYQKDLVEAERSRRTVTLPSFLGVLEGSVKPAGEEERRSAEILVSQDERIMRQGSLTSFAEHLFKVGNRLQTDSGPTRRSMKNVAKRQSVFKQSQVPMAHLWSFPLPDENEALIPDVELYDVLRLGKTPSMNLIILGYSETGKATVAKGLAEKLGLMWLSPMHLLTVAVATPRDKRSRLAHRLVAQMQRGMSISTEDMLALVTESMVSALARTNGYVLDFPTCTAEDGPVVTEFIERLRSLSTASDDSLYRDLLADADRVLPPRAPEKKPPKPPAEVGEDGEAPAEEEEEVEDPPIEEYVPPMPAFMSEPTGPNPMVNCMPRRLIMLRNAKDNLMTYRGQTKAARDSGVKWILGSPGVAGENYAFRENGVAWRVEEVKQRHEEKAARLAAMEEAGEEVPAEEEEEEEPPPALPEDEEELGNLFPETADVLRTMLPFVVDPFRVPKKLPTVPDEDLELCVTEVGGPETCERELSGLDAVSTQLHEKAQVPLLDLHVDGRTEQSVIDLAFQIVGFGERVMCPELPKQIPGANDVAGLQDLLKHKGLEDVDPARRWSLWRQVCPVSMYHEKRIVPGLPETAVEYCGRVFIFASEEKMRKFMNTPKIYLDADEGGPMINAPGQSLGLSLLGPPGSGVHAIANSLKEAYAFDIIDVEKLLEQAFVQDAADLDPSEPKDTAKEPLLTVAEKDDICQGKMIENTCVVRLITARLGVGGNLALIMERDQLLDQRKADKAAAEENGDQEALEQIPVNADGEVVAELAAPLARPARGFVLIGFPERPEQLEALESLGGLRVDKILRLKVCNAGEGDAADAVNILEHPEAPIPGNPKLLPFTAAMDKYLENIAELETVEGLGLATYDDVKSGIVSQIFGVRMADVPLEAASEEAKFVVSRRAIDPFYPVVSDPTCVEEIPDPDIPVEDEEPAEGEGEEGEPPPKKEPPFIQWGGTGVYCPVTLNTEQWLVPGLKDKQVTVRNRVYALATDEAIELFQADPRKYIPMEKGELRLPPPRILITGPTGSGVERQCELVAKQYKLPVLRLQQLFDVALNAALQEREAKERARILAEKKAAGEEIVEGEVTVEPPGGEELEPMLTNAMRLVLGSHIGACVIDGQFFLTDQQRESLGDEEKEMRALETILRKARRVPDVTLVLDCPDEKALKATVDLEAVDREAAEKKAARMEELERQKLEAIQNGEDPPEDDPEEDPDAPKPSDLAKDAFFNSKRLQEEALAAMKQSFADNRCPVATISSSWNEQAVLKAVLWHSKPYLADRPNLVAGSQARKVSAGFAEKMLQAGLVKLSKYGSFSPMQVDVPLYGARKDVKEFAVILRDRVFYPRTEQEQQEFATRPLTYLGFPFPTSVPASPAVAVVGPPMSGKTELCRKIEEKTGAVYLSMPEVLDYVANETRPCKLREDVRSALRAGAVVPPDTCALALQLRLSTKDVLKGGWVLDDFPLTAAQAQALSGRGIVPHALIALTLQEQQTFQRGAKLPEPTGWDVDLRGREVLRQRLKTFEKRVSNVFAHYAIKYGNLAMIDASRSKWAVSDAAITEIRDCVSARQCYYRATGAGKAAPIGKLCFEAEKIEKMASPMKRYCPVSLTLRGALVLCSDAMLAAEYKGKLYWMSDAEKLRLFLDDPDSYLQAALPKHMPKTMAFAEKLGMLENTGREGSLGIFELEGYCPVTLVDSKQMVRPGEPQEYVAVYEEKYYALDDKAKLEKFLCFPGKYARPKLPNKRPPPPKPETIRPPPILEALRKGTPLEVADMLSYLHVSVAEAITTSLIEAGHRRCLYPGKSAKESSLLFLAKLLRAHNPLNTELHAEKQDESLRSFLTDCEVPRSLSDYVNKRYELRARKAAADDKKKAKGKEEEAASSTDAASKEKEDEEIFGWTSRDEKRYEQLSARFDQLFKTK